MNDLLKVYNPANAAGLSNEEIQGLQKLTSQEIRQLANAYPNSVMQKAYLLIIDGSKPAEKQLPSLSTFENLWNLREKNGQKSWVAFQFKGAYKPMPVNQRTVSKPAAKKPEVLDLSDTELMSLPGFKAGKEEIPAEEVKVTKVKRGRKPKSEKEN